MSLNWNLSDVRDEVCWRKATDTWPDKYDCSELQRAVGQEFMHPATDKLVWATMAIGMPTITEKNFLEFYCRVQMFEGIHGKMGWHTPESSEFWTEQDKHLGWVWREGESWLSKLEVIHAHIGLGTNATTETRNQFTNKIVNNFQRDLDGWAERQKRA